MVSKSRLIAAFFLIVAFPASCLAEGPRLALIIGNSKYQSLPVLDNPANDAALMDKSLQSVGFKTIRVLNGSRQQIVKAMQTFAEKVTPDTSVVIYYAGHGIQFDNENYLIPVDSEITDASSLPLETFSLQIVMNQVTRVKPRIAIVILDACRNNPLRGMQSLANDNSSQTAARGLAKATGPLGTYIAYATAPGEVALDGAGRDSPFTTALADVIAVPGLPIEQVFKRVRERVIETTNGRQVPWDNSSLVSDFFFKDALQAEPPLSAETEQDAKKWQASSQEDTPEAYQAYLYSYPKGLFAELAGLRIREMSSKDKTEPVTVAQAKLPANRTVNAVNDVQLWNSIESSRNPDDFDNYLKAFPDGLFSKLARLRMEDLTKGSLNDVTRLDTKRTPNFVEFNASPLYPAITDCDRLAGHVQEIADPAVGVYFGQIQPEKAIPACLSTLKQYPDSMRILVNYGRAIDAAGRHEEAREIYRKGAEAGFPIAYRSLGDVYRDGRGVEKNMNEARYWYVLGAAKENVFAEYNLALIYEGGLGVPADKKKAIYWLWRGARQGFAPAMEKLSGYYLSGDTVIKDAPQAQTLLEGAAEMGNVWAQQHLGELLINNHADNKAISTGRVWIRKSALQGNPWAQAILGNLFREGTGGEKSAGQALKWLVLARKGGANYVDPTIAELTKKLGSKAKAEADKFAERFVAHPNG